MLSRLSPCRMPSFDRQHSRSRCWPDAPARPAPAASAPCPQLPSQTSFCGSAPSAPVLQTLDVPLSEFPKAVGTLLTGIRGNLITGFIDQKNGSNLGVVYDRKTGIWTPIKYPGSSKTSVYGPAITQTGYRARRQLPETGSDKRRRLRLRLDDQAISHARRSGKPVRAEIVQLHDRSQ